MLMLGLKWSVLSLTHFFSFLCILSPQINHRFHFLLACESLIWLSISWHKKTWNAVKFKQQFQDESTYCTTAWIQMRILSVKCIIDRFTITWPLISFWNPSLSNCVSNKYWLTSEKDNCRKHYSILHCQCVLGLNVQMFSVHASVSQSIGPPFFQGLYILTIRWSAMTFCTDIRGVQRVNHNDPFVTFPLLLWKKRFMFPSGWIVTILVIHNFS